MDKMKFNPKSFLNVKELSTQEDLFIKGGGKDKKKDQKKDKKKDADSPNALIYTIVSAELHSVPTNEGR